MLTENLPDINPEDLDLPEKFHKGWRPNQLMSVVAAATCKKYAFILDAPTGTGKSITGAAVQRLRNKNAIYLAETKQLQDQILADFPYAKTIKGRSNYPCLRYPKEFPKMSADLCTHTRNTPCNFIEQCPYTVAKREALDAPLAVLNYSYYLHEINHVGKFSENKNYVICDEGDILEDQLMGFISFVATQQMLEQLHIPPPKFKTKFEAWLDWGNRAYKVISEELDKLDSQKKSVGAWNTIDIPALKRRNSLEKMKSRLSFFTRFVDNTWVWIPEDTRWTFKPVWVSKYAGFTFWKHIEKTLCMSATILSPYRLSRDTGLATAATGDGKITVRGYEYLAIPSPFPKEIRPVYYDPVANLVYGQMSVELPKLARKVQWIMDKHPNEKILVHTTSYAVRDFLRDNLTPASRIMYHDTVNRTEQLTKYKESKGYPVMLSPSMSRGVDLPYDQCRVVVIAKCPAMNTKDPQINKRMRSSSDGSDWYSYKTICKIVQMAGRGVRSADDFAVTYILDSQFEKLLESQRNVLPQWFKEAIIT